MQYLDQSLSTFLPLDRRWAIRDGIELGPDVEGTALFADLSGFTQLTARLVAAQGPDRGGETLAHHMVEIFSVLVAAIHDNNGSVISFAGDAIMCWFDGDTGAQAVRCALQMQESLPAVAVVAIPGQPDVTVSVKVGAAAGRAIRAVLGAPEIQLVDVLAGPTIDRMAAAEQLATGGEVIVDAAIVSSLGTSLDISETRFAQDQQFSVVASAQLGQEPAPSGAHLDAVVGNVDGNWLLPTVYERFRLESKTFSAGFRTMAVLFVQFGELNFDEDPDVVDTLDRFVQWVQRQVSDLGGAVIGLTLGDKGSYLHASFGAVRRHEDDLERALTVALEVRDQSAAVCGMNAVKIGVSHGLCYFGPCGSSERQTFGAIGTVVNLAARLMDRAENGQILVDEYSSDATSFRFENAGMAQLKGFRRPESTFRMLGRSELTVTRSTPDPARSEITTRQNEWSELESLLGEASAGSSLVAMIEGDAGIGKSHLVRALQAEAQDRGFRPLAGAAGAVSSSTPYHAVAGAVRSILGLGNPHTTEDDWTIVEALLSELGEAAVQRAALLNDVIGSTFVETDLVGAMTGRVRADNTIQLVTDIVDRWRSDAPLLVTIENTQWLDSATWALIQEMQRLPATLITLTGRRSDQSDPTEQLEPPLADTTRRLLLGPLTDDDVRALAALRLGATTLPSSVGELITVKAEGNPFFVEELAYALRDTGRIEIVDGACLIVGDDFELENVSLPHTIEGVVLSRIDLLPQSLQLVVRVASVIGQVFGFDVLHDIHPVERDRVDLPQYLDELERLDISELAATDPLREYIFRQTITRDAAYGSLTYGQRHTLHELIGSWYEIQHGDNTAHVAAVLAHHWSNAGDRSRAVRYLDQAGDQALRSNANTEALRLFQDAERACNDPDEILWDKPPIAVDSKDAAERHYKMGEAWYRLGNLAQAARQFRLGLERLGAPVPSSQIRKGLSMARQIGRQVGQGGGARQLTNAETLGANTNQELLVRIHERMLETSFMANDSIGTAYSTLHSVTGAERLGPSPELADAYSKMCIACGIVPLHRAARMYEGLARKMLARTDDPIARANVLMGLSVYRAGLGHREITWELLEEALAIFEHHGNRERQRICLELQRVHMWLAGDLGGHHRRAMQILDLAVRDSDHLYQSVARNGLISESLIRDADASQAIELGQSLQLLTLDRSPAEESKSDSNMATALLRMGQIEAAYPLARRAIDMLAGLPPTSFGLLDAYVSNAKLAIELAESHAQVEPEARAIAKRAYKSLAGYARVYPIGKPSKLVAQARLGELLGNGRRTESLLRQAVEQARRLDMPLDFGVAQLELGKFLAPGSERTTCFDIAADIFEQVGSEYYQGIVEQAREC